MPNQIDPSTVTLGETNQANQPEFFANYIPATPPPIDSECAIPPAVELNISSAPLLSLVGACIPPFPDPLPSQFIPPFLPACQSMSASTDITYCENTKNSSLILEAFGPESSADGKLAACGLTLSGNLCVDACKDFSADVNIAFANAAAGSSVALTTSQAPDCGFNLSGIIDVVACEELAVKNNVALKGAIRGSLNIDKSAGPPICGISLGGVLDVAACETFQSTSNITLGDGLSGYLNLTPTSAPNCGAELNGVLQVNACTDFTPSARLHIYGPAVRYHNVEVIPKGIPDCGFDLSMETYVDIGCEYSNIQPVFTINTIDYGYRGEAPGKHDKEKAKEAAQTAWLARETAIPTANTILASSRGQYAIRLKDGIDPAKKDLGAKDFVQFFTIAPTNYAADPSFSAVIPKSGTDRGLQGSVTTFNTGDGCTRGLHINLIEDFCDEIAFRTNITYSKFRKSSLSVTRMPWTDAMGLPLDTYERKNVDILVTDILKSYWTVNTKSWEQWLAEAAQIQRLFPDDPKRAELQKKHDDEGLPGKWTYHEVMTTRRVNKDVNVNAQPYKPGCSVELTGNLAILEDVDVLLLASTLTDPLTDRVWNLENKVAALGGGGSGGGGGGGGGGGDPTNCDPVGSFNYIYVNALFPQHFPCCVQECPDTKIDLCAAEITGFKSMAVDNITASNCTKGSSGSDPAYIDLKTGSLSLGGFYIHGPGNGNTKTLQLGSCAWLTSTDSASNLSVDNITPSTCGNQACPDTKIDLTAAKIIGFNEIGAGKITSYACGAPGASGATSEINLVEGTFSIGTLILSGPGTGTTQTLQLGSCAWLTSTDSASNLSVDSITASTCGNNLDNYISLSNGELYFKDSGSIMWVSSTYADITTGNTRSTLSSEGLTACQGTSCTGARAFYGANGMDIHMSSTIQSVYITSPPTTHVRSTGERAEFRKITICEDGVFKEAYILMTKPLKPDEVG